MEKTRITWFVVIILIITTVIPTSAFADVNKSDLKQNFKILQLETKDNFLYRDFELNGVEDYEISITNSYFSRNPRIEKVDTTKRGNRINDSETTVIIKSITGDYEKTYHLLNHEHTYKELVVKPTDNEEGYLYKVCAECDSMYFVRDIAALSAITASVSNGIGKSTISWKSAGEVDGYEIWRKKGQEAYSYYSRVNGTSITVPTDSYEYKIRYYVDEDGNRTYGLFSNTISVKKASSITLKVNTKKVNGSTYSLKTHDKVQLAWTKIPDASYYTVYKSLYKTKKYTKYKTVSSNKLNVTGLKAGKTYYFKVKAYNSSGKSLTSKYLKVQMRSKTDGYFYNKSIWYNSWNNILITSGKASNSTMHAHKVKGYKPYVKYNYSTKYNTLYIHNYITFKGKGVNSKYEYYKYKGGKWKKTSTSKNTYKTVALSGIKKYWQRTVVGDKYDFGSGVRFKVRIVNHVYTKPPSDQLVIQIEIGVPQSGYSWFYATGDSKGNGGILLATQNQLKNNKNQRYHPESSMNNYKNVVAHEYGHNLGLDDAYVEYEGSKKIYRMTKTKETCHRLRGKYINIMNGDRNAYATDNDIEMALQAQSEGTGRYEKRQYYKTYYVTTSMGKDKHTKSSVIRR